MGTPPRGRGRLVELGELGFELRNTPAWAGPTSPGRLPTTLKRGTPPRGRGRLGHGGGAARLWGNTPAWAGPTARRSPPPAAKPEHPRVGGADVAQEEELEAARGTPPRGRGRHVGASEHVGGRRNTPAWAGPTHRDGEQGVVDVGTPPRGRGRHREPGHHLGEHGNTPAWAGPTSIRRTRGTCTREHPRVGGADAACRYLPGTRSGTPPRGRGRRGPRWLCPCLHGNTPAWAGPTSLHRRCARPCREHPRVGGADILDNTLGVVAVGTPPRGRGRRGQRRPIHRRSRNTPAWAGPTKSPPQRHPTIEEHPRVGGADTSDSARRGVSFGTPPRGRGRLTGRTTTTTANRNTPAWAGPTGYYAQGMVEDQEHPRVGGADTITSPITSAT